MAVEKNPKSKSEIAIWFAVILAIGLAVGGGRIGSGVFRATNQRVVTVKGLAERDVVADVAVWSINISRTGDNLAGMQSSIDSDLAKVKKFLTGIGFKDAEIQPQRISIRDKFAHYTPFEIQKAEADNARAGKKSLDRYVLGTGLTVRSDKVALVDSTSRQLGELVKQGITLTEDYEGPAYIFNGLNNIKVEMIEQATKNARDAADQFARDSGASIGAIKSANQGVFSIEARDSVRQWDNEKQYIDKKVRVVSTITYYLK